MKKMVWFDLDGTVYRLYDVVNWLDRLEDKDATVFMVRGAERKSIRNIDKAIRYLKKHGVEVGVITWAPKGVKKDERFFKEVEQVKREWVAEFMPIINQNRMFVVEYGTPKHEVAEMQDRNAQHILIDDNDEVRKTFRKAGHKAINAKRGYIKQMVELV